MTIKLKADCELAKAILKLEDTYGNLQAAKSTASPLSIPKCRDAWLEARAHLLEVIHGKLIQVQGMIHDQHPIEPRRNANEIMGVVSDE